jgi:O-antigen ligase
MCLCEHFLLLIQVSEVFRRILNEHLAIRAYFPSFVACVLFQILVDMPPSLKLIDKLEPTVSLLCPSHELRAALLIRLTQHASLLSLLLLHPTHDGLRPSLVYIEVHALTVNIRIGHWTTGNT